MNVGEMRTAIGVRYPNDGSTAAQKLESLNEAHQELYRLSRKTKASTATTVAGQQEYTLEEECLGVKWVTWDGDRLEPRTVMELWQMDSDFRTTTGTPAYYYVEGDRLGLAPIDNEGSKTLKVWWYGLPAALVDDTDTPDLPADYHRYLVHYGCFLSAVSRGDPVASSFKALYDEGAARMREEFKDDRLDEYPQVVDVWW